MSHGRGPCCPTCARRRWWRSARTSRHRPPASSRVPSSRCPGTRRPPRSRPPVRGTTRRDAPRSVGAPSPSLTCVARFDCTTAVVDVSVEVVALARLLGLRVVAVRQSGRRDDVPHGIAHDSADVVWIPQHPMLEPDAGPVDDRWWFTGAFSRFDDQLAPAPRSGRRRATGGGARRRRRRHHLRRRGLARGGRAAGLAGRDRRVGRLLEPAAACAALGGSTTSTSCCGRRTSWSPALAGATSPTRRRSALGWSPSPSLDRSTSRRCGPMPSPPPVLARRLAAWPTPAALGDVLTDAMSLDRAAWRAVYDRNGARRAAELVEAVHAS